MKPIQKAVSTVAVAFGLSFGTGSAVAAALTIDDTNPDDSVTISANDFEFGVFVALPGQNPILIQQGLNSPGSVTVPETAGELVITGTWINPQGGQDFGSIFLTEPETAQAALTTSDKNNTALVSFS